MCEMCGIADEEYAEQIATKIRSNGWTTQYVLSEDERNPGYGYTLGLSLHLHPEFIVFDEVPDRAYLALKPLAWAVIQGREFDEGDDLSEFYPPPDQAELLRFPDSSTHLLAANGMFRLHGGPPIAALQLVWPNRLPLIGRSLSAHRKNWGAR
jgi:hypothetical protein